MIDQLIQRIEREPGLAYGCYHNEQTNLCCALGTFGRQPSGAYSNSRRRRAIQEAGWTGWGEIVGVNDLRGPKESSKRRKARVLKWLRSQKV